MAQRKTPPAKTTGKSGARPPAGRASFGGPRPGAKGAPVTAAGRPPARKPGKSIVNQKQTPWGLIATTVAVVLFAAAVVVIVIATHGDKKQSVTTSLGGQAVDPTGTDRYRQPELPAAKKIKGVTYTVEGDHTHVNGLIKYDSSPPVGGDHDQFWANCNGTVYDHQIANENAVHMLEHGAVWITYNPKTLDAAGVAKLKTYVAGQDRMAMSPYAGLRTPISLQAWGYQLFVDSASDPRIQQFITTLKYNQQTTPEIGASCTDPYWNAAAAKASRPGHPFEG
jgi:hypothetical protein